MTGLTEWARALLNERHYGVLATLDGDGSPHLTPVWYLFRDEELLVGAPSTSRKVKNVAARPTASLVVDVRTPGTERWVAAAGPVTIVRGEEARTINAAIQRRYLTEEALSDPRIGPAFAAADDVTLRLSPSRWRGWSAADLDAQFFGGILGATPQKWFRPLD